MASQSFFSVNNGLTILLQTSVIGLLGIGMTMVIITGGIDLSVGSVLALAGVGTAMAVKAGVPVGLAMGLGVVIGAACGAVNGLVVTKAKIPPFVATLGMMLMARGLALQLTGAAPISQLGEAFGRLGNGALFRVVELQPNGFPKVIFPGIPYPAILLLVVAAGAAYMLHRRQIGRHIYATGSNEEAARLSGVRVDRTKLYAYVMSGALAGLAGNVLMSRLVTAQPSEGVMYELDACLRHHDRRLHHRHPAQRAQHGGGFGLHPADRDRRRGDRCGLDRPDAQPALSRRTRFGPAREAGSDTGDTEEN